MPIYDDTQEDDEVGSRKAVIAGFYDDNWDKIVETENFLWMFDHLPKRMRLMVDFKIEGRTNEEIAKMMNVTVGAVEKALRIAKKRFIRANR